MSELSTLDLVERLGKAVRQLQADLSANSRRPPPPRLPRPWSPCCGCPCAVECTESCDAECSYCEHRQAVCLNCYRNWPLGGI